MFLVNHIPQLLNFKNLIVWGYTDPKQRWDDLVSCGVKLGDVTLHSAWRKALEPLNKELLEKII